jgi:hypothetical protein
MDNVKLPIALVLAMAVQLAAAVWWVSKQAHTIDVLKEEVVALKEDVGILFIDTDNLINFATFTENRWAEAYSEDMTYIRHFGTKPVPQEKAQ